MKGSAFFFSAILLLSTAPLVHAKPQQSDPSTVAQHVAQQGPLTLKENHKLAEQYPTPSGWLLANACAGCHGTNGSEMDNEIPPIVGMDKATFIATMHAYKKEKPSKSTVMTIVAEPLTDKEIEAMADYFSKQKVQEWTATDWNKNVKIPAWAVKFSKGEADAKQP